jgi:phage protein D
MADPTAVAAVTWQGNDITSSVRSIDVEDHDRYVDKAEIIIEDPSFSGTAGFATGQDVTVTLGWPNENAVIFEGVVARPQPEAPANGRPRVRLVAYDKSWKLHQNRQPAIQLTTTLTAEVRRLIQPAGLAEGKITAQPDPSFSDHPMTRNNLTNLECIYWLAELYRSRAFCERNDGVSKFYFVPESLLLSADSQMLLTYCHGASNLIEFQYERSAANRPAVVTASPMDPDTGEPTPAQSPSPPSPAPDQPSLAGHESSTPDSVAITAAQQGAAAAAAPLDQPATGSGSASVSDPPLVKQAVQPDQTRVLGLRGKGRAVGSIDLRAKGKVTVSGVAPWACGDWYVHKVVHTWRAGNPSPPQRGPSLRKFSSGTYETRFEVTR